MNDTAPCCSACAGVEPITPQSVANPPGLSALHYRVGTHAAFMDTMQARLSAFPNLAGFTARDTSADASVAVLDAWACVADILSFYQERIANEGYLQTATEQFSLGEIGRLVGYKPRPGVSASAFLAVTMDTGYRGIVPMGTRAQSLPGPNELPQTFETSALLEARAEWNNLAPRRFQPQRLDEGNSFYVGALYVEGIASRLNAGDPLLLVWGQANNEQVLRRVARVETNAERGTTLVHLVTVLTELQFFAALRDMHERVLPNILIAASLEPSDAEWAHGLQELDKTMSALLRLDFNATGDDADKKAKKAGLRYLKVLDALDKARKSQPIAQTQPERDFFIDELIRLFKSLDPAFRADADLNQFFDNSSAQPKETRDNLFLLAQKFSPNASRIVQKTGIDTRTAKTRTQNNLSVETSARLLTRLISSDSGAFFNALAQINGSTQEAAGARDATTSKLPKLRPATVFALRVTASLFGHNALPPVRAAQDGNVVGVNGLEGDDDGVIGQQTLFLERDYSDLTAGDWAVIETDPFRFRGDEQPAQPAPVLANNRSAGGDGLRPAGDDPSDTGLRYTVIQRVQSGISRSAYGTSGKTTVLTVAAPSNPGEALWWRRPVTSKTVGLEENPPRFVDDTGELALTAERKLKLAVDNARFSDLRRTVVYSKSEPLVLASEPIFTPIAGNLLELDAIYEGLTPGRRILVAGERTDLLGAKNISAAEVAVIAGIDQTVDPTLPGDSWHTTLTLSKPLQFSYTRATAKIYGSVVDATHGETRTETLGSGNAGQAMQRFTLRQKPLTQVSAPTPSGIQSTLRVAVDDVIWHEAERLYDAAPDARVFVSSSEETGETTLYFGDGERGARLPTGQDNIQAVYRTGIGRAGNVGAGAISQLVSRPLGVKSVTNPVMASGGADAETMDTMRQHIPLSLASLERLISQSDYVAFSRVFAGVGKASAARLASGRGGILQITLAGVDDGPLDPSDDLMTNLKTALRRYGDPTVALSLQVREKKLVGVRAKIKIAPDYLFPKVAVAVQEAVWSAFSFERRDLGQTLFPAEVIRVMQNVPGVDYVDLDFFSGLSETDVTDADKRKKFLEKLQGVCDPSQQDAPVAPVVALPDRLESGKMLPAQIAYLDAALPETLVLSQIV